MAGITISTNYAGEVLEAIFTLAVTGNEVVDGGYIHVIPGVESKLELPRMKLGQIIQDRKATPSSADAQGTFDVDHRDLEVFDYMVYTEFNPRSFENYWRKWQPTGNLVFRELPADVQIKMAGLILSKVDEYHGQAIFTADKTSGVAPYNKFNGLVTILAADSLTKKIASPVALTAANIKDKLDLVYKAVPKAIKKNPRLRFFISTATMELYEEYLIGLTNKGTDPSNSAPQRYRGVTLVPLAGFPDDCILAAVSGADEASNLKFGCAMANDENVLIVDRLQANSEMYFFKMLLKGGTQVVFPEETVLYKV